ncbi:MAG: hypothetical protein ACKORK_08380, partial [Gemmatimonadota bacterium]
MFLLRSVIAVGNARLAVLAAENALAGANASLSRLVGSATLVTAAPDDQRDAALRVTRSDAE